MDNQFVSPSSSLQLLQQCHSWSDFVSGIASLSDKRKGDAFEQLVRFVLLVHPTYVTKLQDVWLHSDIPASVREKLHLPPQLKDFGIDIVARTFAGEYWAVQAKFRSEAASLSFTELATWSSLTFAVSGRFKFALVCTTTGRVTSILQGNDRIGFLTSDFWTGLGPEIFFLVRSRLVGKPARPVPTIPKPHQARAIEHAFLHFVTNQETRGKFISPCGSGKTLTAWWIAERLNARRILVAVPSLYLINQVLREWLREAVATSLSVHWLCVCSDDSAGEVRSDGLVTYIHDLGIPCQTDASQVADSLRKLSAPVQVVLTTYQSSRAFTKGAGLAGWSCDLAIFDEAHKTVSHSRSVFTHLLFDGNYSIPRRLFMTATERRFVGATDEVISMDDVSVYGRRFEVFTFAEAISSIPPVLSDYEVQTIAIKESEVERLVRENRFVSIDSPNNEFGALTANAFASLAALRRAVGGFSVKHAVSFHSSILRAEQFRDAVRVLNGTNPNGPQIIAFHVSGRMPSSERAAVLREFARRVPAVVTNARCLTEGVDVPEIDCVLFVDPKASAIDIVQATGRALRVAAEKPKGYVILPFVVPDDVSLDKAANAAGFGFVVFILRALASNDERIIDELRAISQGRQPSGTRVINFDVSAIVPTFVDAERFIESIELRCWGRLAKIAWMSFAEAKKVVQDLNIRTQKQFRAWRRGDLPVLPTCPADMPANPDHVYKYQGWISWGDFLGTGYVSPRLQKFRSYSQAREYVLTLGLRSPNTWDLYRRGKLPGFAPKPADIPSRPENTYASEWVNWGHFLGYAPRYKRNFRRFVKAREFARSLGLNGQREWKKWTAGKIPGKPTRPDDIPSAPDTVYTRAQGWRGYGDWLGNPNRIAPIRRTYRSFEAARELVRSLRLRTTTEYDAWIANKLLCLPKRPLDIPSRPNRTYAGKGWSGWNDWLGRNSEEHRSNLNSERIPEQAI